MALCVPLTGSGEEEDLLVPLVEAEPEELAVDDAASENAVEDLVVPAEDLPLPLEPLRDPLMDGVLLPDLNAQRAEADAFEDLVEEQTSELASPGWGSGGGGWTGVRYDSRVRGSELLPSGFSSPMQREGFRFGLGLSAVYDSNVRLLESDEVDDIAVLLSPLIEYRSGPLEGVPGIVVFSYEPIIRKYLDDSDLDTVDHAASFALTYAGSRGEFRAEAEYGLFAESNLIVGGVADSESFLALISGSYRVSDRTTVSSEFSHRYRSTEGDGGLETSNDVSTIEAGVQWMASPNFSVGPALRYSETSADTAESSESLSYLVEVQYTPVRIPALKILMSGGLESVESGGEDTNGFTGDIEVSFRKDERFSFLARLGYQDVSAPTVGSFGDTGGGDEGLTGGLIVTYAPNEIWSSNAGVTMVSVPSPTTDGQTASPMRLNAELVRALGVGALTLGGELTSIEYKGEPREDDSLVSASLRYTRPIFGDSASFYSSVRWSENSGLDDWSRFQMTTGLNFEF